MRPSGSAERSACLVIAGVVCIALGLDTRVLSKLSSAQTASLETGIAQQARAWRLAAEGPKVGAGGQLIFLSKGNLPSLDKLGPWINSAPLTRRAAQGQGRPHRFLDLQLHQLHPLDPLCSRLARELSERRPGRDRRPRPGVCVRAQFRKCRKAVTDLGIQYPVALDNDYIVWTALKNNYWPAHYFFDARGASGTISSAKGNYGHVGDGHPPIACGGRTRSQSGRHGEGDHPGCRSGAAIRSTVRPKPTSVMPAPTGSSHPADRRTMQPKTYAAAPFAAQRWALEGNWIGRRQSGRSNSARGAIAYRFHARDLHLVLGSGTSPCDSGVTIDGKAPEPMQAST